MIAILTTIVTTGGVIVAASLTYLGNRQRYQLREIRMLWAENHELKEEIRACHIERDGLILRVRTAELQIQRWQREGGPNGV